MYKGDIKKGEIEIKKELKVFENKYCSFYNDEVKFPSGIDGNFLRLEMKGGYSVAILPVTKSGEFVLIKPFRHSARGWGYEVPKGYGDEGESHLECVKRELLEETGLVSNNYIDLGVFHESPSTIMYGIHCFAALDCEKTNYKHKEDTEVINGTISVKSLEELPNADYKDAITEMLVDKYYLYKRNNGAKVVRKNNVKLVEAHKFSINNKENLLKDRVCGCFYCLKVFSPNKIKDWLKDTKGTALCPYCGVDAIIGESSGFPVTTEFLSKMNEYWF